MPHSRIKYILFLAWISTFIISGYLVRYGPEMTAFWCYLTFLCDIPIVINAVYEYRERR